MQGNAKQGAGVKQPHLEEYVIPRKVEGREEYIQSHGHASEDVSEKAED